MKTAYLLKIIKTTPQGQKEVIHGVTDHLPKTGHRLMLVRNAPTGGYMEKISTPVLSHVKKARGKNKFKFSTPKFEYVVEVLRTSEDVLH